MAMGSHGGPLPSDFRENQEREELKRFKAGDRVRVNDSWKAGDDHLQEDNRVGAVIEVDSYELYWLHMDKPVIEENDEFKEERPSIIPDGHAYYAVFSELELIEAATKSRESFNIDQWRKNLKVGDKVRVIKDPQTSGGLLFLDRMNKWKGCVVTLLEINVEGNWRIKEGELRWNPQWFEPLEKPKLSKPKKTKEPQKQPPDPRLKNLIQTALKLIKDIEKTFRDSQKYPIFGINLAKQEPEEKTRKSNLGESLLSLGIVLYHLFTGQSEHNNHSYLLDGYPKPKDMPEGFWKVVNKLLKSEYRSLDGFKEDLKEWKKALREGVVEDLGKSEESIENKKIKKIWQTQVDRLIELGYHEALNMTEEDFTNPDLIPLPDPEMKNPILVVPANVLRIRGQMGLIWVDDHLRGLCRVSEEVENLTEPETPNTFYWIDLIQDGREYLGKSPNDCLRAFIKGERGLTTVEGIALVAQYPQTLKHHWIDLVGSQHRSTGQLTCLWLANEESPLLSWRLASEEKPVTNSWGVAWGAASCHFAPQEQTNKDSS